MKPPNIIDLNEQKERRKLMRTHALKPGDGVYLHPKDPHEKKAYFGIYEYTAIRGEGVEFYALRSPIEFRYHRVKNGGIWLPIDYDNEGLQLIPVALTLERKLDMFKNEEIQVAMRKLGNPNYELIKRVMTGTIQYYICPII